MLTYDRSKHSKHMQSVAIKAFWIRHLKISSPGQARCTASKISDALQELCPLLGLCLVLPSYFVDSATITNHLHGHGHDVHLLGSTLLQFERYPVIHIGEWASPWTTFTTSTSIDLRWSMLCGHNGNNRNDTPIFLQFIIASKPRLRCLSYYSVGCGSFCSGPFGIND